MSRAPFRTVRAALLAAALAGCSVASSGWDVSVGDTSTLTYGWEDRFGVEWTVEPETAQTRIVSGRVFNRGATGIDRMRLLVQASDDSGRPVAQRLVWLPGGVGYFEVHGMPAAAQYRVTVWDYSRIETASERF
jgi:hypothetical protein